MGFDRQTAERVEEILDEVTSGGATNATHNAEVEYRLNRTLDINVDPKGPEHLGPVRLSLNRFGRKRVNGLLEMAYGPALAKQTDFDGTASTGEYTDIAAKVLEQSYNLDIEVLGDRYDLQIAHGVFNDVEDTYSSEPPPVYTRTQFEMADKIIEELTKLVPGYNGCGNMKEDSEIAIFGAAYLTRTAIYELYGLKWDYFIVSDEPIPKSIPIKWIKEVYGDDVLERVKENGYDFTSGILPSTATAVKDLQKKAHAFFLQITGKHDRQYDENTYDVWSELFGKDHVIRLPDGTTYLHFVEAVIMGLTEGVFDLVSAEQFLLDHKVPGHDAQRIVRAVAHIPIGAQTLCENFSKLPKAGDLFAEKTDAWPVTDAQQTRQKLELEPKEKINWL